MAKESKHASDCPRGDPWIGFIDPCTCGESERRKAKKEVPKVSKTSSNVSKTAATVSVNADEVLVSALIEAARADACWRGDSFASDGDPSARLAELRTAVLDRLGAKAEEKAWKCGVLAAIEAIYPVEAAANKRMQETAGVENVESYTNGVLAGVRDAQRAVRSLLDLTRCDCRVCNVCVGKEKA